MMLNDELGRTSERRSIPNLKSASGFTWRDWEKEIWAGSSQLIIYLYRLLFKENGNLLSKILENISQTEDALK